MTKRRGRIGRRRRARVPGTERARGVVHYDKIYTKQIEQGGVDNWTAECHDEVSKYVIGSVLDIACGLGGMANWVGDNLYFGVDFSPVAIKYAKSHTANKKAAFAEGDVRKLESLAMFDTVLLLEVLEHVDNPIALVDYARKHARKRIIITVPRDMPGVAHVKPKWNEGDLVGLLGDGTTCKLFGGALQNRWWLAVKEL